MFNLFSWKYIGEDIRKKLNQKLCKITKCSEMYDTSSGRHREEAFDEGVAIRAECERKII